MLEVLRTYFPEKLVLLPGNPYNLTPIVNHFTICSTKEDSCTLQTDGWMSNYNILPELPDKGNSGSVAVFNEINLFSFKKLRITYKTNVKYRNAGDFYRIRIYASENKISYVGNIAEQLKLTEGAYITEEYPIKNINQSARFLAFQVGCNSANVITLYIKELQLLT